MLNYIVRFFLENKLITWLLLLLFVGWGVVTAPFEFNIDWLPRDPVAVDAIPDIGENQQIVFTKWMGRSPQDVEDQITYPLTSSLLGIPGVKSVRSNSMFGFSSIYLIFNEDVEFYWSRSRILEKLNSLPQSLLPENVSPTLGPDATALGQIYWYTLEGRDPEGNPTGGWDPQDLRSIQDFYVQYGLLSAEGVSEVASIGGFVKEYRVDVDPELLKSKNLNLSDVMSAIKGSNIDVGAQTIEINQAEYFVRGLGYVKSIEDIEQSVIKAPGNIPITIGDVARVYLGPAARRGLLDKSGADAVGGVVVARYGSNPLEVINNVKEKIKSIGPGLPSKTLADGTISQVTVVPFYDRTQLINETIGTLEEALTLEILITAIVVILLLLNLKSSLLVAGTLPIAVLMCFISMRYFGVDANIVALSGIAIAIGTMVDMGIVLTESIIDRKDKMMGQETVFTSVYEATTEVGSAVLTAVATTVISFLPVFAMEAAEGKLFRPLAYTKTFALISAVIVALCFIPPLAHSLFSIKLDKKKLGLWLNLATLIVSIIGFVLLKNQLILIVTLVSGFAVLQWLVDRYFNRGSKAFLVLTNVIYAIIIAIFLTNVWMPLGVNKSLFLNSFFVILIIAVLLGFFWLVIHFYEKILRLLLKVKLLFLLLVGFIIYTGFQVFSSTGQEFIPSLNEGSFLLMPTSMPHTGVAENEKNLRLLDMAVTAIPEVESVVGKAGRVNSALDPAPMSMYENVINYKSEYKTNVDGHKVRYRYEKGEYIYDDSGELIPDKNGRYYRQWRDEIRSPDDIWNEIVKVTKLPGVTSAPKLQPIETRLVMLQTGMRAPMGIKVRGQDLATIEQVGLQIAEHLKDVEGVKDAAVFADRIVGKPYLLIDIDRAKINRYGLQVAQVQLQIQATIGGMTMTNTVEGRERYPIRIRYPLDYRSGVDRINDIYLQTPNNGQIRLGDVVDIKYEQGPQAIKSEDGFLIGYVLFDKDDGYAEVDVVNNAQNLFDDLIANGELEIPAGINYVFAGNYEQQVRANKRLSIVVPIALALIFLILYLQFRSVTIALMVFSGVFVAFAGGFIMIQLYASPTFMDFDFFGANMRDLFQIRAINLSVAVWVGFLALFGIATDDGVLVATFLRDSFKRNTPDSIAGIRDAVVEGGQRRVRPAMMTTATTILALLPVLTSTGRGSNIMIPMAIPSFGGMTLQVITMFTVPVLFCLWKELNFKIKNRWLSQDSGTTSTIPKIVTVAVLLLMSGLGQTQSVDDLIDMAKANNPGLKALDLEYQAADKIKDQKGDYPDPKVSLGLGVLPVETRLGAQRIKLGVTQMIPWKGLLDARVDLASAQADIKESLRDVKSIDIEYTIRTAYAALIFLDERKGLIADRLEVLEVLEELAKSAVRSGKGKLSNVLFIQRTQETLEEEFILLDKQKEQPTIMINRWTGRPLDSSIDVIYDRDTSRNRSALRDSIGDEPQFRILENRIIASEKAIELTRFEEKPKIGVGLDYAIIDARNDVDIPRNGRDILMPMGSITIPLNKGRFAAKRAEEKIKQEAILALAEDMRERFKADVTQAHSQIELAELRINKSNKLKLITRETLNLMRTEYASEGTRFEELLRLEMELIDYDMEIINAEYQMELARATIYKYQ